MQSHLSNGCLDLLYLAVILGVYNTLSHIPFFLPNNLGPSPTIPIGAMAALIPIIVSATRYGHKTSKEYDATDRALKQLLLGTVDDMFIAIIRHRHSGFANVTMLQIHMPLFGNPALKTTNSSYPHHLVLTFPSKPYPNKSRKEWNLTPPAADYSPMSRWLIWHTSWY